MLERADIALPVRFEFAERVEDEAELATVKAHKNDVWLVYLPKKGAHSRTPRMVKKDGDRWFCSTHKLSKTDGDCDDIRRVKHELGFMGINPYPQLRRRPATIIIYPKGSEKEDARRQHAKKAMPTRYPKLAEELSRVIGNRYDDDIALQRERESEMRPTRAKKQRSYPRGQAPRKRKTQKVALQKTGPKPLPTGLVLYAFLQKVKNNWTYDELAHHLELDGACQRFGWLRRRGEERAKLRQELLEDKTPIEILSAELVGPGRNTLCKAFGWSHLPKLFSEMITESARLGRLIDDTILVDSHETPTCQRDNSRNSKFDGAKRRAAMVKAHFGVGKYSNLITWVDITMHEGRGSGDPPHLRTIVKHSLEAFDRLRFANGDLAYDVKDLYSYCARLEVNLETREKIDEDHTVGWPESAKELAILRRKNPGEYRDKMRFRNKGEGTPSRVKRRTAFQRMRRRQGTPPIPPTKKVEEEVLCALSDERLQEIFDRAAAAVGPARQSEALAMHVRENLIQIVVLEQLHDQIHRFDANLAFNPIRIVREEDLLQRLKGRRTEPGRPHQNDRLKKAG